MNFEAEGFSQRSLRLKSFDFKRGYFERRDTVGGVTLFASDKRLRVS
jgi:hypothetical protein